MAKLFMDNESVAKLKASLKLISITVLFQNTRKLSNINNGMVRLK